MRPTARLLAALALAVTACTPGPAAGDDGKGSGRLVVFAAASLAEAFGGMAEAFEEAHPGVTVIVNAAGSQRLAHQLREGAAADVFASASPVQMDAVAGADLLAEPPVTFAQNRLAIAVEAGNPLRISGLADLAGSGVLLVMAAEGVPAGDYARAALDQADVQVTPASLEADVRAVLAKVALGEADAGIVYASDVATADGVEPVAIPDAHQVTAAYPIATLAGATRPRLARAFVAFVTGPHGQALLDAHGFSPP